MSQKFKDLAKSTLTSTITSGQTSLTVGIADADKFPVANTNTDPVGTDGEDFFKLVLKDASGNIEIVYVRTRALGSAVMSNVIRGQEGTTALSFLAGSVVGLRYTAQDIQNSIDSNSVANATAIAANTTANVANATASAANVTANAANVTAIVATAYAAKMQPFNVTMSGGNLTVTVPPVTLDFRNTNLTGLPVKVSASTPFNVTLSGGTLGQSNGTIARIAVTVVNNNGTLAVGLKNTVTGDDLSETALINTSVANSTANSSSTMYTQSAISNAAYRVLGSFDNNQSQAGNWSSNASVIHTAGGNTQIPITATLNLSAATADQPLAVGQVVYVDVAAATTAALKIATADNQMYSITYAGAGGGGSTGNTFLNPNNTTYANFFYADGLIESGGGSSVIASFYNAFLIAYAQDPRMIEATVVTKTGSKNVFSKGIGYTVATGYVSFTGARWQATASNTAAPDTTTAWTSLGTVVFPIATTGRIWVRRLA